MFSGKKHFTTKYFVKKQVNDDLIDGQELFHSIVDACVYKSLLREQDAKIFKQF